jgi:hypothetical protein
VAIREFFVSTGLSDLSRRDNRTQPGGLTPEYAESYHPFGIKSDKPFGDNTSLAPAHKIDSTSSCRTKVEDEDDDEYENEARLLKTNL